MRSISVVLGTTLLLVACGDDRPAADPPPQPAPAATAATAEWRAALAPDPDHAQIRGSATARSETGQTVVNVELAGGEPGAVHPWHIHLGDCGTHGDYFHDEDAYPPLQLDGNGTGTASAHVPAELRAGEAYNVNVHGARDHDVSVACGELRRG